MTPTTMIATLLVAVVGAQRLTGVHRSRGDCSRRAPYEPPRDVQRLAVVHVPQRRAGPATGTGGPDKRAVGVHGAVESHRRAVRPAVRDADGPHRPIVTARQLEGLAEGRYCRVRRQPASCTQPAANAPFVTSPDARSASSSTTCSSGRVAGTWAARERHGRVGSRPPVRVKVDLERAAVHTPRQRAEKGHGGRVPPVEVGRKHRGKGQW